MHKKNTDAIATERVKRGTYFVEKEKEEETLSSTYNEKVLTSLYWLCKQEVAHSKLNSLLELLESPGVDEVAQFSKRSSTVLRELLLIIGNQMKEDLLGKIKKSPFLVYLRRMLLTSPIYKTWLRSSRTMMKKKEKQKLHSSIRQIY